MVKINNDLRFVFENCIDLINEGKFEELYRRVYKCNVTVYEDFGSFIRDVTEVLLSAGIDPLKGQKNVPECFLYESNRTMFEVPEGIEVIEECAFFNSKIAMISLPSTLWQIRVQSLDTEGNLIIKYNGTKEEWNKINICSNFACDKQITYIFKDCEEIQTL